jgi:hypothetical protein
MFVSGNLVRKNVILQQFSSVKMFCLLKILFLRSLNLFKNEKISLTTTYRMEKRFL